MTRRVVISGLGPVSGCGLGIEDNWQRICNGASAIDRISAFDPGGFECRIAAQVNEFKVRDFVPKSYRKAVKVMSRDIELAVAAADIAARDAKLSTPGTDPDIEPSYDSGRIGCHIGAGLIAADIHELTMAMAESRMTAGPESGRFDMHQWGNGGMEHLTPLWLLKYLPNMLACHVTIIHDTHGPSNTITCGEASSGLSIGESLRVIQRDKADICFCGGAESKLNPIALLRQEFTARLTTKGNDNPAAAIRPFDHGATGMAVGEGGGIILLEAFETFTRRTGDNGNHPYAEVLGFGAAQTVYREARNRQPDPQGRAIIAAIQAAMREAAITADTIDLVVPLGSAIPKWDRAELAALKVVFGDRLKDLPVTGIKAVTGNCGAGAGGLELAIAAKALLEQTVPAIINRDHPLEGLAAGSPQPQSADLTHALVYSTGYGGQNVAMVLKRM